MKVFLVVPPNFSIKILQEEVNNLRGNDGDFTKDVDWRPAPPLGVLYIAGALRKAGYQAQIYDLHREFYVCRQRGYFQEHSLVNFFEEYFEDILKKNDVHVLGISCLFNVSSSTVEKMGEICRRVSPATKIVIGGGYPSNMYRDVLQKGICEYVILGEAEEEFIWLLHHLNDPHLDQKVENNPFIVDSKCCNSTGKRTAIIKNLDMLPMPAWDMLPYSEDYIKNSISADRVGSLRKEIAVQSATIFTTRGCPMKCTFCASHSVHGKSIRAHSVTYIMNHIDWLVEKYDINNLVIQDDMFNFSSERVIQFCKTLFGKYQNRFNLEFPSGLAVWNLNEEVIIHLKKVGLNSIAIAVESGSPYVQKFILKKNLNLSLVKEKVDLLKKYEIGIRAFYIIGFVGETLDMMQQTVQFALDLNIDWSEIKIFTPLVGSEMYESAQQKGYLVGDTSEHVFGRCCLKTPDFTPEQVKDIQYDANIRINFLNNRFLKNEEYEKAEQIFRGLLRNFPNHLFAHWGLWQSLKGQKNTTEATEALNRLHQLKDSSIKSRNLLEKYNIQLPFSCC